jgi:hypothetical protein
LARQKALFCSKRSKYFDRTLFCSAAKKRCKKAVKKADCERICCLAACCKKALQKSISFAAKKRCKKAFHLLQKSVDCEHSGDAAKKRVLTAL